VKIGLDHHLLERIDEAGTGAKGLGGYGEFLEHFGRFLSPIRCILTDVKMARRHCLEPDHALYLGAVHRGHTPLVPTAALLTSP
jgi:hypothetical protein